MDDAARARLQAFGDLLDLLGRSAAEAGAAMTAPDAEEAAERWGTVSRQLQLTATATDQLAMETEAQPPGSTGYSAVDAMFLGRFFAFLRAVASGVEQVRGLVVSDPPAVKARRWREAAADFRAAAMAAAGVAEVVRRGDDTFGPGGRRV